MKMLFRNILAVVLSLAFVSTSHGGMNELSKLVENKDFWATFKWENFEDTDLYKSTEWHPPGWSNGRSGNVTRTSEYTTEIRFDDFSHETAMMYAATPDYYIGLRGKLPDDYDKLVAWCNEKFGDTRVETKRTQTHGEEVREWVTSSWTVGNTIITIEMQNVISKPPPRFGYGMVLRFKNNKDVNAAKSPTLEHQ